MKELYDIIIAYAREYPILIPFVIFGFFYIKNERFRKFTNKTVSKFLKISFSNHLFAHDLFFQRKLWLSLITRIQFNGPDKTKLYRILLEEKVNSVFATIDKKLRENKKAIKSEHVSDVLAIMIDIINEATILFELNLLKRYEYEYSKPTGKKLYDKIYTQNFKKIQDENIERIINRISSPAFLTSRNTDDTFRSYFTKIQDRLDDAIADAKETLDLINGGIEEIIEEKDNA